MTMGTGVVSVLLYTAPHSFKVCGTSMLFCLLAVLARCGRSSFCLQVDITGVARLVVNGFDMLDTPV